MSKFPQKIYQTHDNWGETQYADWETMNDIITSLRELGDGWETCSMSEMQDHTLIKALKRSQAAYEGGSITDSYSRNHRREIVIFEADKRHKGYFNRVNSFDPKRDSEELIELGINV